MPVEGFDEDALVEGAVPGGGEAGAGEFFDDHVADGGAFGFLEIGVSGAEGEVEALARHGAFDVLAVVEAVADVRGGFAEDLIDVFEALGHGVSGAVHCRHVSQA